jgi:hypothetical protein
MYGKLLDDAILWRSELLKLCAFLKFEEIVPESSGLAFRLCQLGKSRTVILGRGFGARLGYGGNRGVRLSVVVLLNQKLVLVLDEAL